MALTDTFVKNIKFSGKTIGDKHSDGNGLYLLVNTSGKYWRLNYRYLGKQKTLALGVYPDVPLAKARQRRDKARELLAEGQDPSVAKREEKIAKQAAALNTFETVAEAWLTKCAPTWDEGTHEKIRASLVNHVYKRIGPRPIAEVRPADIRDLVQAVEATGARETAGRVFQRIKAIYRYAAAHELVQTDPTYPLRPAEILKRQTIKHRAALAERDVPQFLQTLRAYGGDSTTRLALHILMLTALRPGELRGAKWDEIDEDRALWRVPAARMKMKTEHTVPLARQTLELLKALHSLTGTEAHLFPSPYYPGKPISDGTLNSALARMGYKGVATAHGFRTLFSTCANEAGWNTDVIEKQLAHEERDDVRGAYNRASYLPERQKLMQWWADHLDQLKEKTDA